MSKHELIFDEDTGATYGSRKSYVIGFMSSIILTIIAFYLVITAAFPPKTLYIIISGLAIVQLFVQLIFFLHVNTHSKSAWNLLSLVFTLVVVLILVIGSLWIMYNLYDLMGMNAMSM